MRPASPLGLDAHVWYPPERDSADRAVAEGRVGARTAADLGYRELPVSNDLAPPDMAVRAARELLDRVGRAPDTVASLFHASVHHQGHDAWSAPHYIAHRLGVPAVPIGLLQQCNGGAAGVELAAAGLAADPEAGANLVTTADRFLPPSWDRWRGDYGMAAGDAATAVLVHRDTTRADLLLHGTGTAVAAELEVMHRGRDGFDATPLGHGPTIDVRRPKRAFVRMFGVEHFVSVAHQSIAKAVADCLACCALEPDDPRLRWAVLPRLGTRAMAEAYVPPLTRGVSAPLLDLGRSTGHLGAGDLVASLAELVSGDLLAPGEHALVLNGGGGFTFTAAIVSRPAR
ncbi:ketoacyl-ACP synthase III family protein [Actinosynnema sp. NPDC051121]